MREPRCPACGGELAAGIVITSGAMWADSRTRFVPARFLDDRSLFGRYRTEIATAARACLQCGAVTLFVNPGTLAAMVEQ
ncbi:MAG: hypothetical protein ACE5OS_10125 [Anaerolineae bacterium]